ncbi:MAG: lysophospholipid acyltransferase family protein [Planctomycetota bacterium]
MQARPGDLHRGWILPALSIGAALPRGVAGILTDLIAGATGPASAAQHRWFLRFCTDFARLRRGPAALDRLVARAEGLGRIDEAARAGRGLLLVSAHLGNWELGAAIAARRGLAVTVVSERAPDPALDRWREETRARCGVATTYLGDPALAPRILEVLRGGGCVAMLVDREPEPGSGAARIAAATGAALLPAFVPFLPDGRYAAIVEPPARDAGELRAAVARAVDLWRDQWYPPPAEEGAR